MSFYEESGKSRHRSSSAPVERELEALSSLDRVTRTEMVHGKHPVHHILNQNLQLSYVRCIRKN